MGLVGCSSLASLKHVYWRLCLLGLVYVYTFKANDARCGLQQSTVDID